MNIKFEFEVGERVYDDLTNHEGEWSLPEFELLKDIQWEWTEKVDGTNIRIEWNRRPLIAEVNIKGKTDKAEIPEHLRNYLKLIFTPEKLQSVFELSDTLPDVILFGEGYGFKIQNGGKYFTNPKDVGFVLFDIKIGKVWLKREDLPEIAFKLGIPVVPYVGAGTIQEAIDYVKMKPFSGFGNQDFIIEGLVLRPKEELNTRFYNRIICKIKVKDFYESN